MTSRVDQIVWSLGYILLAIAITLAVGASVVVAVELMRPGISIPTLTNTVLFPIIIDQGWREYPSLPEGPVTTVFNSLQSIERYGFLTVLAVAAGLTVARWSMRSPRSALLRGLTSAIVLLAIGLSVGSLVAGGIGAAIMVLSFVGCLRRRTTTPPIRYLLLAGTAVFCLGATRYLAVIVHVPDTMILHDTMFIDAGWRAIVFIPAVFMTLDLVDRSDGPSWVGVQAACLAGFAGVAAIFASIFLGLGGMPLGFPNYPDAYANWHFIRSVSILIIAGEVVVLSLFTLVRTVVVLVGKARTGTRRRA